jgi:hypothetical protein
MLGMFKRFLGKQVPSGADDASEPAAKRTDHRLARHEPIPSPEAQEGDQDAAWEAWNNTVQAMESRPPENSGLPPEPTPEPFQPTLPVEPVNKKEP